MARYFASNSLTGFIRNTVDVINTNNLTSTFDTNYTDVGIYLPNGSTNFATSLPFGPVTGEVWMRFDLYTGNSLPSSVGADFRNGAAGVFRLAETSAGVFQGQYWNGTAWVNTGASASHGMSSRITVAIKLIPASGFELYINGVLATSGSGWTGTLATQVDRIRLYPTAGGYSVYSQVMVTDYNATDDRLYQRRLTGGSAVNTGAATGVFGDINSAALTDDTGISISTSGAKAGYTKASTTVPSGLKIAAMVTSTRARTAGSLTDGKLGLRSAGTDYSSSALGLTQTYGPKMRIDEVDPATSSDWTASGFNAAEIYLEGA